MVAIEALWRHGELSQGEVEHRKVVVDVMGRRVARPQHHGQCLVGGVAEASQGVEAIATFVIGSGSDPLRVGIDQRGVEVQDQRPVLAHRRQSGRPGSGSGLGSGFSDAPEQIGVDRIDDPRSRRGGGHGTEEARLVTQDRQVREAVAPISQGEGHIEQDTAGIVAARPAHRW